MMRWAVPAVACMGRPLLICAALSLASAQAQVRSGAEARDCLVGGFVDVLDQLDSTAGVAPLVVVPGHEFHKVVSQGDASLLVEDAGVVVANEVGGDHVLIGVPQNAREL